MTGYYIVHSNTFFYTAQYGDKKFIPYERKKAKFYKTSKEARKAYNRLTRRGYKVSIMATEDILAKLRADVSMLIDE